MTDRPMDCGSVAEALALLRENHPLTGRQKDRVIEILQAIECRSVADGHLTRPEAASLWLMLRGGSRDTPEARSALAKIEAVANGDAKSTEQESVSLDPLRSIVSELQDFYDSHAAGAGRILRQAAKLENWIDAARLTEEKSKC